MLRLSYAVSDVIQNPESKVLKDFSYIRVIGHFWLFSGVIIVSERSAGMLGQIVTGDYWVLEDTKRFGQAHLMIG